MLLGLSVKRFTTLAPFRPRGFARRRSDRRSCIIVAIPGPSPLKAGEKRYAFKGETDMRVAQRMSGLMLATACALFLWGCPKVDTGGSPPSNGAPGGTS